MYMERYTTDMKESWESSDYPPTDSMATTGGGDSPSTAKACEGDAPVHKFQLLTSFAAAE